MPVITELPSTEAQTQFSAILTTPESPLPQLDWYYDLFPIITVATRAPSSARAGQQLIGAVFPQDFFSQAGRAFVLFHPAHRKPEGVHARFNQFKKDAKTPLDKRLLHSIQGSDVGGSWGVAFEQAFSGHMAYWVKPNEQLQTNLYYIHDFGLLCLVDTNAELHVYLASNSPYKIMWGD